MIKTITELNEGSLRMTGFKELYETFSSVELLRSLSFFAINPYRYSPYVLSSPSPSPDPPGRTRIKYHTVSVVCRN